MGGIWGAPNKTPVREVRSSAAAAAATATLPEMRRRHFGLVTMQSRRGSASQASFDVEKSGTLVAPKTQRMISVSSALLSLGLCSTAAYAATAYAELVPVLVYVPAVLSPAGAVAWCGAAFLTFRFVRRLMTSWRNRRIVSTATFAMQIAIAQSAFVSIKRVVERIAKIVGTSARGPLELRYPIAQDLSILSLAHTSLHATAARHAYDTLPAEPFQPASPSELEDMLLHASRFMKFTTCCYGITLMKALGILPLTSIPIDSVALIEEHVGVKEDDIVSLDLLGAGLFMPAHFTLWLKRRHSPPSFEKLQEWLGDEMTAEEEAHLTGCDVPWGEAHAGFVRSAAALYAFKLDHYLNDLIALYPSYTLVVTGHSLGAGTATCLLMFMLHQNAKCRELAHAGRLKCYNFAPPPSFRPFDEEGKGAFPSEMAELVHKCIFNFAHSDDIVPKLSVWSVVKVLDELVSIDSSDLLDGKRREAIANARMCEDALRELEAALSRRSKTERASEQTRVERQETRIEMEQEFHFAELQIPGPNLYWFINGHDLVMDSTRETGASQNNALAGTAAENSTMDTYSIHKVPRSFFSRIHITESCIRNHFPDRYERALDDALANMEQAQRRAEAFAPHSAPST
ncbi:hypothetical protein FVE85_8092 [Porphyridium purpureum]|uniref:sn-1-specific diacylglycerol lipase n=1 Tax=Porphyridium purpureum TaxID=35688 RepID=A0A5J4YN39_PORPP|nr:hypothetical protein FVE85_8092 [Porphyridium purpureum]|eukprot:POR4382..scf295_9